MNTVSNPVHMNSQQPLLNDNWLIEAFPQPPFPKVTTSYILFQVTAIHCKPWDWCSDKPQLHFEAHEYLDGFHVTEITLRIGDYEKRYEGSDALLTLPQTGEQGAWINYWAVSNSKDGQSQNFRIKYRYVPSGDLFRFDVLDPTLARQAPSASVLWGLFPPLNQSLPRVLIQPSTAQDLYSANRYIYLSGHLIRSGLVNAAVCPDRGVDVNGAATLCGERVGADQLLAWQNQYNEEIYTAAIRYNIPARVLKGIMAQESQFWPSSDNPYELGLGMFTENGADMLLRWNVSYYLSDCIPVYGTISCSAGYSRLDPEAQLMLRRGLMDKVGTQSEIDMLAATLYASAAQVNQMVLNTASQEPAAVTNYESMWMISTANYYAGSGCIGTALQAIHDDALQLTWEQIIAHMDGDCEVSARYVQKIFSTDFNLSMCNRFDRPLQLVCHE